MYMEKMQFRKKQKTRYIPLCTRSVESLASASSESVRVASEAFSEVGVSLRPEGCWYKGCWQVCGLVPYRRGDSSPSDPLRLYAGYRRPFPKKKTEIIIRKTQIQKIDKWIINEAMMRGRINGSSLLHRRSQPSLPRVLSAHTVQLTMYRHCTVQLKQNWFAYRTYLLLPTFLNF